MLKWRYLLFFSLTIGFFFSAKATHNRAGEITYQWISGYTYKIKITTYTNIGSPNLADRCYDTLYLGDGGRAFVPRTNGNTTALCGTSGPPFDGTPLTPTLKLNEYVTMHTYPGPGNYLMSMTDPNRNAGVINLPNSVNQVFYIESYLVISSSQGPNNSPVLTFPPIDKGCVNQCFYHNPGAYDIDGDSISYELTPCRGAGGTICPGYFDPPAGTGGTFNVDPFTGTVTWCQPQQQGEYNFAMLIKEWRLIGGIYSMIGYIIRDMQVDVGVCDNIPPHITINNVDSCILAGTNYTNTITGQDADGSLITLSVNGGPFMMGPGSATFSTTAAFSNTSGLFSWNTTYNHVRRLPYRVTVKLKDSGSQIGLVDYKTFNVKIIPEGPTNLVTTPANEFIRLNWVKPLNYSTTGTNPFLRYGIYRKQGMSTWVHSSRETAPPAYTGYAYVGFTHTDINDTMFFDFNGGQTFPVGPDYSYLVLGEYKDGSTSYVSNISLNRLTVGINEVTLQDAGITVYPNPANDACNISFDYVTKNSYTIDLLDMTGRKIKTVLNNEFLSKQPVVKFSLEGISQGIYFIKITVNGQTITKKIIKQ